MSMRVGGVKFYLHRVDIGIMKKLALIVVFSVASMALNAEEYTIQTISALKESSITSAFEKKIEKSALPSAKIKEGECNIVTVGQYGNTKEARSGLKKAKTIAKDAFVRPISRTIPKVCATQSEERKSEEIVKTDINASVSPVAVKAIQAEAEKPKETAASAMAAPAPLPAAEVKSSIDSVHSTVLIYDRNCIRKSDIHEAIEYYKNSPYHTFRPVALL